jgi:hypothetical protein
LCVCTSGLLVFIEAAMVTDRCCFLKVLGF